MPIPHITVTKGKRRRFAEKIQAMAIIVKKPKSEMIARGETSLMMTVCRLHAPGNASASSRVAAVAILRAPATCEITAIPLYSRVAPSGALDVPDIDPADGDDRKRSHPFLYDFFEASGRPLEPCTGDFFEVVPNTGPKAT